MTSEMSSQELDLESVRGALDELFLLARHYKDSGKFRQLLEFVAGFKRYSAFNAALVHIQMPGAKYVLPAKRWAKEYGRSPARDAQPLVMLQPMGPVMFGFDVAQTEGRALPAGFGEPFEAKGRLDDGAFRLTIANAAADGVDVKLKALGSTLGGFVRNASDPEHEVSVARQARGRFLQVGEAQVPVFAEVVLNANLSDETNYATLTHELGHLYCGHVGTPDPRWWPDRTGTDRNTGEFEAESVSYVVCRRAGLETPAVEYLHGYLGANAEVPSISLELVFKAANRIEQMRVRKLPPRKERA